MKNSSANCPAWLTQAGLAGTAEADIFSGFCDRGVAAGIPLGRAHLFIDTLHPVHEGRLFRWGFGPNEPPVHEYGRTSLERLDVSGPVSLDVQATAGSCSDGCDGRAERPALAGKTLIFKKRLSANERRLSRR